RCRWCLEPQLVPLVVFPPEEEPVVPLIDDCLDISEVLNEPRPSEFVALKYELDRVVVPVPEPALAFVTSHLVPGRDRACHPDVVHVDASMLIAPRAFCTRVM